MFSIIKTRKSYLKSIQSKDRVIEEKDFKFPIETNAVNLRVIKSNRMLIRSSPSSDIKKDIFVHLDVPEN